MDETNIPSSIENLAGKWLVFQTAEQRYGIHIIYVQELRGYEPNAVTRIANAPTIVKGVINLRGQIIPVVDLRLKMGVINPQDNDQTVIVILSLDGKTVGAVVDAVSDVLDLNAEQIKAAPNTSGSAGVESFLSALAEHDDGGLVQLVDIKRMLASYINVATSGLSHE